MSIWKYLGGAVGALPGIVTLNPALAAAGAATGYGLGGAADAANQSADAAQAARDAANGVTTPQVDPRAGISSGWGGLSGREQATVNGVDAQEAPMMDQYHANHAKVEALKKAYYANPSDANYKAWTDAASVANAQVDKDNKVLGTLEAQRPSMLDPARFNAQAQASYDRRAPQVSMVRPDAYMGNYSADRGMFAADGRDMSGSLLRMRSDPVASGYNQQQLVGRLNSDLNGGAPSLAQAQLNQTTGQNIANQRAMAATAGPMDYAAAQRAAIMSGANAQQQAIGQAATLRAQEYAQARGELGSALSNQRQQTLQSFGMQNDTMTQQRAQELQAMGLDAQSAVQRAQLEAQQRLNNATLQAGQNQLNQGREMGYLGAYQDAAHMQQNNAQFNVNANLQAQQIKAGLQGGAVQAQMQDAASQRQMAGSMIGAGATMGASWMQSHPSTPTSTVKNYYKDDGF